jgi:SNF2 family DNA or RNA helicase
LGGPVLIVCPNALKSQWRDEIRGAYPNDKIVTANVGGRFGNKKYPLKLLGMVDAFPFWVIVHYAGIRINTDEIRRIPWKTVILDECHYIKNRKAQRTKAAHLVTPKYAYRIGLTATPFGKDPSDAWSQLRWAVPNSTALRSYWKFFESFVDYEFIQRGKAKYRQINGGKNMEAFSELMSYFGVQRSKKSVAPQLPDLIETHMPIGLDSTTAQGKMYKSLRKRNRVEVTVGDVELVVTNVLARITRMEQVLSSPWIFKEGVKGIKLEWLLEWAEAYPFPAVIATRFKASAKHIAKVLEVGNPITGDIPIKLRDGIIKRWQNEGQQFLVGTIATIGTGLNLQHAHAMIAYDQVHDPIQMEQLRHRIHRINSDHSVQIIYPYIEKSSNEIVNASFRNRLTQMEFVRKCIEFLQSQEEDE